MDRDANPRAIGKGMGHAARFRDGDGTAENASRGRAPHRQYDGGPDQRALVIQPPSAGLDLACVWPRVKSPLTAPFKLEMLDRIGHENRVSLDPDLLQRPIEHFAGRTDKRFSGAVFVVARLLAHQHQTGMTRALARYDRRGILVKAATAAHGLLARERGERGNARAVVQGVSSNVAHRHEARNSVGRISTSLPR